MRLGFVAGYGMAQVSLPLDLVLEAERLGFDSAWTSEAYGTDAVSTAAWLLARTTRIRVGTAIMQMPARTPTCAAMTAMTLNALSGGRFLLGIGPSGPRVVEGWYGVAYGRPLSRTREYIAIIRQVAAREAPLVHQGRDYRIPYAGDDATGLGAPMKSILHADRALRIYTAAVTPKGLALAAEIADGVFPIWLDPARPELIEPHLAEGLARAGGRARDAIEVAPFVPVSLHEDVEAARRPVREHLALYIGGMGPRGRNFYHDYARRMGYEAAAARIQDLYLAGERAAAAAAVPEQLIDAVALVGPAARIRARLAPWKEAGRAGHVSTMLFGGASAEALRLLAAELL
ncbi:MAG: LLM class F420-dependent oxidoreductase [Gammaproteobacteria bacterium]|nr:MAG: LLM class F420-dependent oxidoreductase [Gammaproteobacteria bacterium]